MLDLTYIIAFFISCLIIGLLSFLNGLDRAKWEKEEALRKLKNLAEFEREREEKTDER